MFTLQICTTYYFRAACQPWGHFLTLSLLLGAPDTCITMHEWVFGSAIFISTQMLRKLTKVKALRTVALTYIISPQALNTI